MLSDNAKLKEIEGILNSAKDSIHRAEQVLKTLKNDGTTPAVQEAVPVVAESFDIKDTKPEDNVENNATNLPAENTETKETTPIVPEVSGVDLKTGVFDGEKATGSDGTVYPVDATFASKNRLVKGDVLEIKDGADPIIKETVMEKEEIGILKDQGGYWVVNADNGKSYKVLTESITVFDLRDGDKVVINIPSVEESDWAAIDGLVDEYIPEKTEESDYASNFAEAPLDKEATPDKQNNEITEEQNSKETGDAINSTNSPVITEPAVSSVTEQASETQSNAPEAELAMNTEQNSSYIPDQDEAELVNEVLDRPSNNFQAPVEPAQPTFMNPTSTPETTVAPAANPTPINPAPANENLEYASPTVAPAYDQEQSIPVNTVPNSDVNQGVKELDI